jgi:hypothetical protein
MPTTVTPTSPSVQEHAQHLLAAADVVHKSNHERKEMLEVMMDQKVFDSNSTLNDSSASMGDVTDLSPVNGADKDKGGKKSRFQTVSELKQQVQDCHKALLTMQENANFKYRKLELQVVEMRASLDSTMTDLEGASTEMQNLEKENLMLQESLQKAVGKDQAEWLEQTKLKAQRLEKSLAEVEQERDQAVKDNETMKKAMKACSQCVKKSPHRPSSSRNLAATTSSSSSWWSSVSTALMGLNEEAEATPASLQIQRGLVDVPPQATFHFQDQTHQIKENLEADIEAMERKMKDDVNALKEEWSKPPKSSGRRRRSRKIRKSRDGGDEDIIGGIGSLDAFFASATQGLSLESEEMDEEQSFYGSRSIASAPVANRRRRKKTSSSSTISGSHHRSRKSSSASDDGRGGNGSVEINRRGTYGTSGRSMSFRENFKASLIGLGDEVSVAGGEEPIVTIHEHNEPDRFHDLQKEVAEWGDGASQAVTVL